MQNTNTQNSTTQKKTTRYTQTHLIIAATFAVLMLVVSWLMGDHEQSATALMIMIGAYTIVAGQLKRYKTDTCASQ